MSARPLAHISYALGIAEFIGQAAADLAPVEWIDENLNLEQIKVWIFLASIPLIINISRQIALSLLVFLSAVMNELLTLPAEPSHIAFALGAVWVLSIIVSPNASAALRITGVSGFRLQHQLGFGMAFMFCLILSYSVGFSMLYHFDLVTLKL